MKDVLGSRKGRLLRLEMNIQLGREKDVRQRLWREKNILTYLAEEGGLVDGDWSVREATRKG